MSNTSRHIYSAATQQALNFFATQIRISRKKRRWSEAELAERAGTTRPTIRKIEQANPSTGIGLYFEVATLLGIALYTPNDSRLAQEQQKLDWELTLLPKRIDKGNDEVFDDF